MKSAWIKSFAAAAGLGIALSTGVVQAMPDKNDLIYESVKATFFTSACTKDGYSVPAEIGVNPSVMDLKRLNNSLPRKLDTVIAEFMRQAGDAQLRINPDFRAAYDVLSAKKSDKEWNDSFLRRAGNLVVQREVNALWQDIVGQLTVEDFIRPDGQPAEAPYYSKAMLETAPKVAPRYQQRIEDNSNGVSVLFLYVAPAQGYKNWQPVKGCSFPAPQ